MYSVIVELNFIEVMNTTFNIIKLSNLYLFKFVLYNSNIYIYLFIQLHK